MVSPGHPSTLRRRWWKWWSSGVVNFQAASGVKGLKNFRQADNLIGKIKWKTISGSHWLKISQKVSFLRAKRATQKNWIFAPKLFFLARKLKLDIFMIWTIWIFAPKMISPFWRENWNEKFFMISVLIFCNFRDIFVDHFVDLCWRWRCCSFIKLL